MRFSKKKFYKYYYVVSVALLAVLLTFVVTLFISPEAKPAGGTEAENREVLLGSSSETQDTTAAETTADAETTAEKTETEKESERETASKAPKASSLSDEDAEELLKDYSEIETVAETAETSSTLSDEENAAAASQAAEAAPDSLANNPVITYSYPTSRMPTGNNTIYLTFTLATEPGYTNQLMDILASRGVHATFFVTVNEYLHNRFIYDTPGIMRRMAAEGHTIGCHGYNHVYTYTLSDDAFVTELNQSAAAISNTVGYGYPMNYYTPPFEYLYQRDVYLVQQQGMTYIQQSFAYGDLTPGLSSAQALQALCSGLADGSIYLLHANAANVGAMAAFIDYAKEQGFQFVALGEAPKPMAEETEDSTESSEEETDPSSEETEEETDSSSEETDESSDESEEETDPGSEESDDSTPEEPEDSAETESETESDTESSTERESTSSSETEASDEEETSSETETESESETMTESESETTTESATEPEPETTTEPETTSAAPETTTAAPETTTTAPETTTTAPETTTESGNAS